MTSPVSSDLSVEVARIDTYRLRRSVHDLYARALIGPVFYMMAWGLLLAVSDYTQRAAWWVALPFVVFGGLWWARYRHRAPGDEAGPEALAGWTRTHWLVVQLGSLLWGVVPALVGSLERMLDSAILIAALSTMAFCTASSQAFAMHPGRARLTIFLLMAPGVVVFLRVPELRSTGVTLAIYGLYLLANLRRSAAEYAHQVDTEVELLRSRAEVALLSLTDPLTGLPNRRSYELVWEQASSSALRQKAPLALLVLDLDHFKSVNDRHGHLGGDACLKHFAGLLQQQFRRESDVIARIGGEEFVVILPCTTAEAFTLAEQLRVTVANSPCRFGTELIAQTVSVGLAALEDEPRATFGRADDACYAAKKAGRNRVETWVPTLQPTRSGSAASR